MKRRAASRGKPRRARLTPSAVTGMAMGAALVGAGLYGAWFRHSLGGYFVSSLGLGFFVLVWFSYKR